MLIKTSPKYLVSLAACSLVAGETTKYQMLKFVIDNCVSDFVFLWSLLCVCFNVRNICDDVGFVLLRYIDGKLMRYSLKNKFKNYE